MVAAFGGVAALAKLAVGGGPALWDPHCCPHAREKKEGE